jgi:hypothetical protein
MVAATPVLLGAAPDPLRRNTQPPPAATNTVPSAAETKTRRIQECMATWTARTHMTKQQWRRTCRELLDEWP